ncbi:hypothetical protein Noda2021_08300 [Candidatus Dependentiae bacterium Noda2021]|nr:hypothetical protein Noda2021_08300 [Candidatus Dependentiae bacterium Noda2021]
MKQCLILTLILSTSLSFSMEDCSRWGASIDDQSNELRSDSSVDVATIYKQLENLGSSMNDIAQYVFLSARLREINQGSSSIPKTRQEEPLDLRDIRNNILNAQHELQHLEMFGDNPKLCLEKRAEIARLKDLEKLT